MFSPDVCVVYDPSSNGLERFRFAMSVAQRLVSTCHVLLPTSAATLSRGEKEGLYDWLIDHLPRAFGEDFEQANLLVGDAQTFAFGSTLVVDNVFSLARRDVDVLAPQFESQWSARGEGPALIPFGNREAGLYAMRNGLGIVHALGIREVVFYHSTWQQEGSESLDPRHNMDPKAVDVLTEGQRIAEAYRLTHRAQIEMVEDVSAGIRSTAMDNAAQLVVLARGLTRHGYGYVDKVQNDFPVPTLVVGRRTREES